MHPGEIYRHNQFYLDQTTGLLKPKYIVLLSVPADDLVARLLTSQPHGRPTSPPCYQGYPYPGFYLGVIGGPLSVDSWVDLRALDDLDKAQFSAALGAARLQFINAVSRVALTALLECAASAEDTTRRQERLMRDTLSTLR